jgi:hypothetical protein
MLFSLRFLLKNTSYVQCVYDLQHTLHRYFDLLLHTTSGVKSYRAERLQKERFAASIQVARVASSRHLGIEHKRPVAVSRVRSRGTSRRRFSFQKTLTGLVCASERASVRAYHPGSESQSVHERSSATCWRGVLGH